MNSFGGLWLVLLVALCLIHQQALAIHENIAAGKRYHIIITNDIHNDVVPLQVRCKSKTEDLGMRTLFPGAAYFFSTKLDYFRRKLYFCFNVWGQKSRYFEAFKATRDEGRCGHGKMRYCFWSAREDGFYFSGDNSTWVNEYPW
ncbi:hypothetical protein L1049_021416 [Liquidambar formosana]|uniref:S-protein homolog n=1 Tax=Liquidambar formosana TaxID=63359 RepID=A0AAP0N8K2_LIQFO